jgi:hypothetical protein
LFDATLTGLGLQILTVAVNPVRVFWFSLTLFDATLTGLGLQILTVAGNPVRVFG